MNERNTISQEWQFHNEAYEASGLTREKFCEIQGLTLSKFKYYRQRIREQSKEKKVATLPGFVPLKRIPSKACSSPLSGIINLSQAISLEIRFSSVCELINLIKEFQ